MWLDQGPPVGNCEITSPVRAEDPRKFAQMGELSVAVANVFDDVIADDDVEAGRRKRQIHVVEQAELVAAADLALIEHVNGYDVVPGLAGKVVRDAAAAAADLQQTHPPPVPF